MVVDPSGQGSAGIAKVTAQVKGLGEAEDEVVRKGGVFGDVFKAEIAADFFRRATSAAIDFGKDSVNAAVEGEKATRNLAATARGAGLGFEYADERAQAFAETLGLSETAGEKAYASIVRLAKGAGSLSELPRISQAFADLAAARGLTATEIADRARQLQNLVDEGTDALFGANPSAIYKEYTAATGNAVDVSDELAKRQAIVWKLMQEGEIVAGEAAVALTGTAGSVGRLSSSFDDLKRSTGEFVANKTAVVDLMNTISDIASGKGSVSDFFTGEAAARRAEARFRALQVQAEAQANQEANARLEELNIRNELNRAFIEGDSTAEFRSYKHLAISRGEDVARAMVQGFKDSYARLFKGDGKEDLVTLDFAQKQLERIKGVLDPQEAEQIGEKLRAAIQKQVEKGVQYLGKVRENAAKQFGLFLEANTLGQGDNPFVKIYSDALTAQREFERNFNVLDITKEGQKQLEALAQAQQRITDTRLAAARVDSQLSADRLRRQADELQSLQGLTAAEERRLGILERQVAAATQAPNLLGRAEALRLGLPQIREGSDLQARVINEQFRRLQALQTGLPSGEAGERAQNSIDRAITSLFDSLPERFQRQIARDPGARGVIGGAFSRQADELNREVLREIERARVADNAVRRIEADLETIRRGGLSTPEADRRILAVLGNLSPNELSPELKAAKFDALLRTADAQGNQEQAARDAINATVEATNSLTAAVDNLTRAAENPELRKILIEVINRSKASVRDEQLGSI